MNKSDVFRNVRLDLNMNKIIEKLPDIEKVLANQYTVLNQTVTPFVEWHEENIGKLNVPKELISVPGGAFMARTEDCGIGRHIDSGKSERSAVINVAITTGDAPIRFYDGDKCFFEHYYTPGEAVLLNALVPHDVPAPTSPRYMIQFSVFESNWENAVTAMEPYIIKD